MQKSQYFHSFRYGGKKMIKNRHSYLCDENSVLLHEVIVIVTPCQQLPHFSSQGLGDTTPHQR